MILPSPFSLAVCGCGLDQVELLGCSAARIDSSVMPLPTRSDSTFCFEQLQVFIGHALEDVQSLHCRAPVRSCRPAADSALAAATGSASSQTIIGSLPPSSSVTCFSESSGRLCNALARNSVW
jgi:hypothetical protein